LFFGQQTVQYTHRVVEIRVSSPPHPPKNMPPMYKKSDYVKVLATEFDNEDRDRAGMNFSERWAADGNGLWCYGTISRVYVKKGRLPQKYSIKYDGGQTMTSVEDTIEPANEDDEDEQPDEGDIDEMNRPLDTDSDTVSCDSEGRSKEQYKDDDDTDEDDGVNEANDDKDMNDGDGVQIGETVVCGDDDDPKRLTWPRIKDIETDQRTADHQQTFFLNLLMDCESNVERVCSMGSLVESPLDR
jgi:hypothetical protein